jgi:hypothetical protein
VAYTLEQLRTYVRQHLDLDEQEVPNDLLDVWARDASIKIHRTRKRWPFLETSWTITTTPNQSDYALSTTFAPVADEIVSIVRDDRRLAYLGRDEAEAYYLPYQSHTGEVTFFNVWNDTLRLYPTPTSADTLLVRGYRKIDDWVAGGSGSTPDFPEEFHDAIRLYLLAMAYLQQEDVELASQFMGAFSAEMDLLKRQYGDAPGAYPIIVGGGPSPFRRSAQRYSRLSFPFD